MQQLRNNNRPEDTTTPNNMPIGFSTILQNFDAALGLRIEKWKSKLGKNLKVFS